MNRIPEYPFCCALCPAKSLGLGKATMEKVIASCIPVESLVLMEDPRVAEMFAGENQTVVEVYREMCREVQYRRFSMPMIIHPRYYQKEKISTGSPVLDAKLLHGCIQFGRVFEVFVPSHRLHNSDKFVKGMLENFKLVRAGDETKYEDLKEAYEDQAYVIETTPNPVLQEESVPGIIPLFVGEEAEKAVIRRHSAAMKKVSSSLHFSQNLSLIVIDKLRSMKNEWDGKTEHRPRILEWIEFLRSNPGYNSETCAVVFMIDLSDFEGIGDRDAVVQFVNQEINPEGQITKIFTKPGGMDDWDVVF